MTKSYLEKHLEDLTNRIIVLEKMVAHLLYTQPPTKENRIKIPYPRPKSQVMPKTNDEVDELFDEAWKIVSEAGKASTSYLQRRMSIGYNRSAIIMDQLESKGIIDAPDGVNPRTVIKLYGE